MAKYHLNPEKGPMRCSAADGQCPYGTDAPHFTKQEDAVKEYEKLLSDETSPYSPHRRTDSPVAGKVGILSYKQHPNAPLRSYHLHVLEAGDDFVKGKLVEGGEYRSFRTGLVKGWETEGDASNYENLVTPKKRVKKEKPPEPTPPKVTIVLPERYAELDKRFEAADYSELLEYANSNQENYGNLSALIAMRARQSPQLFEQVNDCNPKNPSAQRPISHKNFTLLKREFNAYRDQTAFLIEAKTQSKFYVSKTVRMDETEPVGAALPATQYPQSDPRWFTQRFDSIGGSDVGALVLQDYVPEEELTNFDKLYISKVEKSKVVPLTQEEIAKRTNVQDPTRKGPLYRGTIWEDYIRDGYAEDHPELTVYDTKGQYFGNGDTRQRVNFDGILSDREDKKPNGILEIKTGGVPETWEDGIPVTYRAQTLYYLHATGFDFADVRVVINDGDVRDYRLNRDDDVFPGSGVKMADYIRDRVNPWFEELKTKRELTE